MKAFLAALWASQRVKGIAGAIVAGLLLIALCAALWRCSVGRETEQAVAVDRADAVAEATKRVLAADREASAKAAEREKIIANERDELREVARKADTGAGVGPATAGVLDRLRRQQADRDSRAAR